MKSKFETEIGNTKSEIKICNWDMKLKVWNLCLKMKFKWETEIQNRNLDSIEFCQNLKSRFAIQIYISNVKVKLKV